jgi:hypothetical protein
MDWTTGELVAAVLRYGLTSIACGIIVTLFFRWAARRRRDSDRQPPPR